VRLADRNGGIVVNVSERGLALRAARTLMDDQFTHVRFQLSQSDDWVETTGRIAWMNAARTTAGIEFPDLSEEARTLLAQWISSIANANVAARTEPLSVTTAQASASGVEATTLAVKQFIDSQKSKETGLLTKLPRLPGFRQERITPTAVTYRRNRMYPPVILPIILLVTSAALAGGFFGLARYLRSESGKAKEIGKRAMTSRLAPPASGPSSPLRSTAQQRLSSVSSGSARGFVLQAGAMRHAENADALLRSLQQKEFPAFIFKGEGFYEVLVGPYHDSKLAANTRKELQDQGFDAVVRHWPFE
jgi:septal ring-binding cell division protein DamX